MKKSTDFIFEQWLVLQSQSGDREATRLLIQRWNPRLVRHAFRFTNNMEAAKDATQEGWIAIVRNMGSVGDPAMFGAWALRIVGRKAIDWIRKSQRLRRNAEYHANTIHDVEEHKEEADDRIELLRTAMRDLPDTQRCVLSMFYLEGLSILEISDVLGVSNGTIKSRLFRAREHLKKQLKNSNL